MFTMVFKATYEAHGASLCGSVHPFYSPMNLNMAFSKSSRNYGKMCTKKKKTYTGVYWLVVQTCSNIFYFPFHIWDVILPIDFHSYISNMVKTSKQYILRRTDVEWNFCAWASCVGKWDWSWSIPPTLPVGPNPWPIWPFIPRMVQYTQRERGWGSIVLGKL
jgi:hypothetical protein